MNWREDGRDNPSRAAPRRSLSASASQARVELPQRHGFSGACAGRGASGRVLVLKWLDEELKLTASKAGPSGLGPDSAPHAASLKPLVVSDQVPKGCAYYHRGHGARTSGVCNSISTVLASSGVVRRHCTCPTAELPAPRVDAR